MNFSHVPVEISGVPAHWQSLRDWIRKVAFAINRLNIAAVDGFSTGDIKAYAGVIVPQGWLLADGTAVSRDEYRGLFSVIGTTYGGGDGSTTFNLPDLRDRILIGAGGMVALGERKGAQTAQIEREHLPEHSVDIETHDLTSLDQIAPDATERRILSAKVTPVSDVAVEAVSHGGGAPLSILPPVAGINWIIKT